MKDEIVLYQPNDQLSIEVKLENETVWLTQQQMAMLFNTTRNNITLHIGNIFKEGELDKDSVCKESLLTAADGKVYKTNFYNLDAYIDAATFEMLDVRAEGVTADIYSDSEYKSLRDMHNATKDLRSVNTHKWSTPSHDRWLRIDDSLYHCGHSLKDMGKKLSAITLMGTTPDVILKEIK